MSVMQDYGLAGASENQFGRAGSFRAEEIESGLQQAVDGLIDPLRGGSRRVIGAGGKRLRPELVVRCADIGPLGSAGAVDAAVAIELLHSASLVHDDLLDESETRRGVPAIHRLEGPSTALIAGDALIAGSWQRIARSGPDSVDDLATALADMCAGQALEDRLRWDDNAAASDVVRVAELKTGALLRAACRTGARAGGCDSEQIDALGRYGSDLGISLQLIDDVLDLISDVHLLAKPVCADLRAGAITLPTVFALAETGSLRLRQLIGPQASDDDLAEAAAAVLASGSITRTIDLAYAFAARAASACASAGGSEELRFLPVAYVRRQLRTKVAAQHQHLVPTVASRTETATGNDAAIHAADPASWRNEQVG
ncbi:MAG: polyprenyl synthetase family protein [Nakamurella sp.]